MATKKYVAKYRLLKETYEGITGKGISDITWYRTVASLKQYFLLSIESEKAISIVETYAQLKRSVQPFLLEPLILVNAGKPLNTSMMHNLFNTQVNNS